MPLAVTLDLGFVHRVYRTTLILLLITTPIIWEAFHVGAALGWAIGVLLSLGVIVSVEWGVKQFVQAGANSAATGKMAGLYLIKVLLIGLLLALAFYLRSHGLLSLRWLLAGFPVPAAVVVLKLLGAVLRAMQADDAAHAAVGTAAGHGRSDPSSPK